MSSEKAEEAELPHSNLWELQITVKGRPTQYYMVEYGPSAPMLAWVTALSGGDWAWGIFTGSNGVAHSLCHAQLAAETKLRQTVERWVALLNAPVKKEKT